VINGYSELALLRIDSTHLLFKNISEISKAGKKAVSLIRRLLTFSRRQVIEPKIISINELIIALEKMLRRLIGEDITIDLLLTDKCDNIKADPGQIEQILINLIINARDAINDKSSQIFEKKITIETSNVYLNNRFVSLHPESQKGQHIEITITDTGIGMDEKTRLKIFEPFFTTKEEGAGTGLGLSTVYGIVKQNNGSIFINSAPGRGTTFKIYWPASEQKKDFRVDLIEDTSLIRGKETILLVEDEESVRNFTKEALVSMGYTVNSTSNGHEALAFIKKNNTKIDLLISDVIMPKMGGVELADNLEKLLPGLKTLFVSGYIDDKIVKDGILKKNVNFLHKPFSVHSLAKKVNEVLMS
jgi:CheY-like chemotaxis protein